MTKNLLESQIAQSYGCAIFSPVDAVTCINFSFNLTLINVENDV